LTRASLPNWGFIALARNMFVGMTLVAWSGISGPFLRASLVIRGLSTLEARVCRVAFPMSPFGMWVKALMRVAYGTARGNQIMNYICRDVCDAGHKVRNGPNKDLGASTQRPNWITKGIVFLWSISTRGQLLRLIADLDKIVLTRPNPPVSTFPFPPVQLLRKH
jgi:hypothetical protein